MSRFHNPYHFVPADLDSPTELVPLSEFEPPPRGLAEPERRAPHLTHDRFVAGFHSGRIECRLTVETPLICANEQKERPHACKRLCPFSLDEGVTPALSGSGIRGMLSSILEASSGSALRVLSDTQLSHRMAMASESLSAMGLLVEAELDGKPILALQPLTVPTLDGTSSKDREKIYHLIDPVYSHVYRSQSGQPLLKAYVNGYQRRGRSDVERRRGTFLARVNPDSTSPENQAFWYAKLAGTVQLKILPNGSMAVVASHPVRDSRSGNFLLAQQMVGDPISQSEFDKLSDKEKANFTRGFLRILGVEGREGEIPTTKKHEYFIPYPEGCEDSIPIYDVSEAVERFHRLADQRHETDPLLPFQVKGSRRNSPAGGRTSKLRLRAGDIVYFKPNSRGTHIEQVSVSAIWRAGNGTVHEYFADFSTDLLPLAPGRESLTLAEQLFGAVEVRDSKQRKKLKDKAAFALASRVRIHHARLAGAPEGGAWQDDEELLSDDQREAKRQLRLDHYPLKNLASPKPPSPSLYFKPSEEQRNGYVPKGDLNPRDHAPQGRKFYLRRDPDTYDPSAEAFVHPDRLADDDERASIARQHQTVEKFVRRDTTFTLAIDFTNLSDLELQLLLYSLAPSVSFRHQLGHGKPLGLGQVRVQVTALRTFDPRTRYGTGELSGSRWHRELAESPDGDRAALDKELARLRGKFDSWAEKAGLTPMLRSLELVGSPAAPTHPIHYPQADQINRGNKDQPNWVTIRPGTADFEREHYHWFVRNDVTSGRTPGQYLAPLVDGQGRVAASLPALHRGQESAPPPTDYPGPPRDRPTPRPARPVDGGGQGGPDRVEPETRQGVVASPAPPRSPTDLRNAPCQATVEKYETKKGKTRIRFRVECQGHVLGGYLAQPNPNTDKATYPEGSDTAHEFILLNPRRSGTDWICELKKP